jgi:hypothetical protein
MLPSGSLNQAPLLVPRTAMPLASVAIGGSSYYSKVIPFAVSSSTTDSISSTYQPATVA